MRILFLSTNINTYHPCPVFPMGVGALSAYLKKSGHEVRVFAAHKIPQFSELPAVLMDFKPELVGYSVISPQSPNIPVFARMVKDWNPEVPFLCGGAHPSLKPEEVIAIAGVDAVCRGDGEFTLKQYVDSLAKGAVDYGIKGFWFKTRQGEIIRNDLSPFNQDLDSLPFIDRECVDFQEILDKNTGVLWMQVSRGCKWKCRFCGSANLKNSGLGEYVRLRGVDNVIAELRQLFDRYRFKVVFFRDDTFTWDKPWTLDFCAKYAKEFSSFPFIIFSRADALDEEIIVALKTAGCKALWIGYESGNDHIRNVVIDKEIDTDDLVAKCGLLNKHGIQPYVLNIVGLPYETPEMFAETIAVNRLIHKDFPVFSLGGGVAPKVFTFEPFPGTPLYDLCKEKGWLHQENFRLGFRTHVDSYVEIPTFPSSRVLKEYRNFRYNVYRGNHNGLALFYKFYDSYWGELLKSLAPGKAIEYVLRLSEALSSKKSVSSADVRKVRGT